VPSAIDISSVVGLTALGMFTAQILMGLLLSVGYNPIRHWPRQRWIKLFTLHNWLGYIGLATAATHALILLTVPSKSGGQLFRMFDVLVPI
jgi:membrane-anchored protein YejM (alkaline phosphatase superfamily)